MCRRDPHRDTCILETHAETQLCSLGAASRTEIPSSFKRHKSVLLYLSVISHSATGPVCKPGLFIHTLMPANTNIQGGACLHIICSCKTGSINGLYALDKCQELCRLPDIVIVGSLNIKPSTANHCYSQQSIQN